MSPDANLLDDPNLKNMYLKMVDYLSQGDMSEARLVNRIDRLRLRYPTTERYRGYTKENAWKVIPLLRERGFINEERFARNVLSALRNKYDGLRAIRRKMLNREIQTELVDHLIKEYELSEKQDLTNITERARQKYERLTEKFKNQSHWRHMVNQRMYAWLSMRGFSPEEISAILGNFRGD